ncbi:hypothetical protein KIL84_009581 [Mauremys mutica]|uniref:VIT domain-containing protein n=1 Tax=Mauremys mutica TaxID=74926 RepID=A0A9D4AZ17_9SAUR|nr:hypothetical protein KIL84_009581 [Mauremys mutica]
MRSCGLLNSSNKPVPLRSGSVTVLIRGFVADVGCELLYRNDEQGPVEAVFVFPMDAEAAVYAFQARLGGTCIQAQLQEKKQAQELYGDALAGGQSSFLLQQEGTGGDVFSCSLGNLPPGEEAALTLRYVCELPLEPDGAARYMLPAVLRPRYTPHGWDGEDVTQGVPRVPQGELPYTLSLSATLQSPHGIDRVLSNCSLTPLSYTAGNRTSAQVSLAEAPPWDRDMELLVYYAEPHKPSAVLEVGLPGAEPDTAVGGVTLQYRIQDQTYKETLQFPLQPQDGDRLPVHRLAAKSLLLELEGAVDTGSEGDRRRALETSLSSGVVCSLTAYVGVDTERGQPVQGPLVRRDIPLAGFGAVPHMWKMQGFSNMNLASRAMCCSAPMPEDWDQDLCYQSADCAVDCDFDDSLDVPERAPEESPLLRLVSLQNADGSWDLDPRLAAALGVSETDARGRMPSQDVPPSIWATVLAVVWLHGRAVGQRDEWELLEAKAVGWVRGQAGPQLSECLEAANTLLGCSVGPAVFGL